MSCRERHDQSDISRDDGLLIRDAMAGNRDAFAALFDRHYELIYCIAYRLTRNPTDAEDIAQETYLKLARKLNSYRFEARFTAWLCRLTLNTAKDWCRRPIARENGRGRRIAMLRARTRHRSAVPSPASSEEPSKPSLTNSKPLFCWSSGMV